MAQRLGKRPLPVHGLMQQVWIQAAGPLGGAVPQPLDDVPCLAKAGGVSGAQLDPLGIAPVERLHYRGPTLTPLTFRLPISPDISTSFSSTPRSFTPSISMRNTVPGELTPAELDLAQLNQLKPGARQIDPLEQGAREIFVAELGLHGSFLPLVYRLHRC